MGIRKSLLILGAMPSEVLFFKKNIKLLQAGVYHGYPYITGILDGQRIAIGVTGVGITNAAVSATLFIQFFKPNVVIFTGSAARLNSNIRTGDIVIARKAYHHNAGSLTEAGMVYRKVRGPIQGKMTSYVFNSSAALLQQAKLAIKTFSKNKIITDTGSYIQKIKMGSVCSSDLFGVNQEKINDLRKKLKCDLMDMESAAIAQACTQLEVPHLIIRSGSNLVQPNPGNDYKKWGQLAAYQSAQFTKHLIRYLCNFVTSQ